MKNTALITGASNGIGLELAKIHASKGGNLVLVARNKIKLASAATGLRNLNSSPAQNPYLIRQAWATTELHTDSKKSLITQIMTNRNIPIAFFSSMSIGSAAK